MKRPVVIGLVGGIASGKSYVAGVLADFGAAVIDADRIAHSVLTLPLVVRQLARTFGSQILDQDGSIARAKLAELVFGQDEISTSRRKQLESIVHPLVHADTVRELHTLRQLHVEIAPTAAVIDAPLLLEADWEPLCDFIFFVDTSFATRLSRALERGWTQEEFERREAAQLPLEEKRKSATHVIDANGERKSVERQLKLIWDEISHAAQH